MFRSLHSSLGGKLLLFMTISAMLPLLLLGIVSYVISIDAIKRHSADMTVSLVEEKAANVGTMMRESQGLVQSIVSNEQFKELVLEAPSEGGYDRLSVQAVIGDLLGGFLHVDGLVSINISMLDGRYFHVGEMINDTALDASLRNSLLEQCSEINYGLCWPGITPNMLPSSRHGLIIPAIRVLKKLDESTMQEKPVGLLQLTFSLDSLYNRLHQSTTNGIYHVVIDSSKQILYHPEKSRISTLLADSVSETLSGSSGNLTMTFDNQKSLIIYRSLQGVDWTLIGVIPTSPLSSMIREIGYITLGCLLFSALLLFVGIAYIRRQIVQPIHKITEQFRQVKESNVSFPVLAQSNVDEINALSEGLQDYALTIEMERKQAEKLQEAYESLQSTQKQLVESEKMASLGGLVAGVAHEINTPLGIAITAVSLQKDLIEEISDKLEKDKLKKSFMESKLKRMDESSSIALSNLDRAEKLVQSFKQVAVDQSIEEPRTLILKTYLDELVFSLTPQFRSYKIQLELECPEDLMLHTDPGAISQVFTNLIMNALVHAFHEGDEGTIRIKITQIESQIQILFKDDGKGIPKEHLEKIFEPFFTTRRNKGGTGLGLNIIYNLITQKLKGTIICESQMGEGTTFQITLPQKIEN